MNYFEKLNYILQENILENSSWEEFVKNFKLGELELDLLANQLNLDNFKNLSKKILTPKILFNSKLRNKTIEFLKKFSPNHKNKSDDIILKTWIKSL